MSEYYIEAVHTYQQANKNLKHFAYLCAMVDGKKTAALADDCKCSVDTIEQYRNAYVLRMRMEIELESEHVRKLWESVNIDVWKKAAQLWSRLDLTTSQMSEYLIVADEHGMSRDSFAAHVDEKENKLPKWIRVIRGIARSLRRDDWMTEIPHSLRDEYVEKRDALASVLERIAEAVEA